MNEEVILDTGPLVAFLHAREQHHDWVVERFKELTMPFLTCEPVLTEACHLLKRAPKAIDQIALFVDRGWIQLPFRFTAEHETVMRLIRTYRNVPMSIADACLVRMAELHQGAPVLTLDKDFLVYRTNTRGVIPTIMPPGE